MLYAELEDGTKIAAMGTPQDETVHLHIDVPPFSTRESELTENDMRFDLPLDQALDLWKGLGFAIQDAGGSLT